MSWHDLAARRPLPSGFIGPCLPTLSRSVPSDPRWVHEIKHDGYRLICRRDGDRVRIFTRRGNDWTERVPLITQALAVLRVASITLDGEGVVCDANGLSDFERLRAAVGRKGSRDAFLYAFDLLELDGRDLRREPWNVRRATLASLLRRAGNGIRLSEHIEGADGAAVFRHACAMGLEGIVSKRRDAPYRSGRSPHRAGSNAHLGMRVIARTWRRGPVLEVELTYRRRGRIVSD
jgi:bifunctional non-homologous end joining protein LigD